MGAYRAYRIAPKHPGWLDAGDASELAHLLRTYRSVTRTLPSRVKRALHYAEQSCREQYFQEAHALVVRGLESLLKVGRTYVTAQFAQRVRQLAQDLTICVTHAQCVDAYEDRSGVVHGTLIDLSASDRQSEFTATLATLQSILRMAVRYTQMLWMGVRTKTAYLPG